METKTDWTWTPVQKKTIRRISRQKKMYEEQVHHILVEALSYPKKAQEHIDASISGISELAELGCELRDDGFNGWGEHAFHVTQNVKLMAEAAKIMIDSLVIHEQREYNQYIKQTK